MDHFCQGVEKRGLEKGRFQKDEKFRKMLEEVKATAKSEMTKEDKQIRILSTWSEARQNLVFLIAHELTGTKPIFNNEEEANAENDFLPWNAVPSIHLVAWSNNYNIPIFAMNTFYILNLCHHDTDVHTLALQGATQILSGENPGGHWNRHQDTQMVLGSLFKNQILKIKGTEDVKDADKVSMNADLVLNLGYSNKKVRVDLTKMTMAVQTTKDQISVQKSMEKDRKNIIQAAIVRIMKTRKQCSRQKLMAH
ncbi:hypothetical protein B9Z55_028182 [Caenorhabditis nigoni]|uniref:Uncharacterized protein n=1 Tax=Caenorhabditis nigoni TaxID=1611254 RepID=A0A2G5SD19_9PELO|nr:hypothetical protein B9Z55_028182 [Caenorhabditis nigoni]